MKKERLTGKDIKKLGQFIKDYCHKTGKAIDDLYCPKCGTLSFKKDEKTDLWESYCCENCDNLLYKGSPGGQSDTFNFVTKEGLLEKQKNDENKRMTPLLIAMEFGFIECEKGHNLEEARKNLRKLEGGKQNE